MKIYKSAFYFTFVGGHLRKRAVLVLLLFLALAIAAVSGIVLAMNAPAKAAVTVTVEGKVYTNVASIPVKWGTVNNGANTQTITITNHANVNLKPHLALTSPNLPRGWTLTFSLENQLIPAGKSATGTLNLNVPANTLAGNYNWGAHIILDAAQR